jgi:hypothetical protein
LQAQIYECKDAINAIIHNGQRKTKEHTFQDFINIACTLIQDKPGAGQRKPGAESLELITELEVRSDKVKEIISHLDKKLKSTGVHEDCQEEDSISFISDMFTDLTVASDKVLKWKDKEHTNLFISRDKLAGGYQFYQDLIQVLSKQCKTKSKQRRKEINKERAKAAEWALNRQKLKKNH